jgi:hypothetical protein
VNEIREKGGIALMNAERNFYAATVHLNIELQLPLFIAMFTITLQA